ncbi:MAG: hypothetical protein KF816_02080 [Melioribacteraceae bacterium]|nr:hypothetical protein [Melioribacteraceae bacterium]
MKTLIGLILTLMIYFNSLNIAQSDYQSLQNFKAQCKEIEESIKSASSLEEIMIIKKRLSYFRNDYLEYKNIFDNALYPENYESTIEKLEKRLEDKNANLGQISALTTRLVELETQLEHFNNLSAGLIEQIDQLKMQIEKGDATIADLKKLVVRLKRTISERDLLVHDLVDSLLVEFGKSSGDYSQKERKSIITKVNKTNMFNNIKRTIQDNIHFIKITQIKADDFTQMKHQHEDLSKVWKQIGPMLSNVYLNKKEQKVEIAQIDSLFTQWDYQISNEIWRNILDQFNAKGIELAPFLNADQFVKNISDYIDERSNSIDDTSIEESLETYKIFTDNVYYASVEEEWIPLLLDNGMLSQNEKEIIDAKIAEWKNAVTPSDTYWGYIITALLIMVGFFMLIWHNIKSKLRSN